jgi:hypothetical protein
VLGYPRPLDWTISGGSLVIDVPRAARRRSARLDLQDRLSLTKG